VSMASSGTCRSKITSSRSGPPARSTKRQQIGLDSVASRP
jgi:hypothetical protein